MDPKTRLEKLRRLQELAKYAWNCGVSGCNGQPHAGFPATHARHTQLPPESDWDVAIFMAGRGAGKTFAGSMWLRDRALASPSQVLAIIGPDSGHCRDVCLEGPSGIIANTPPDRIQSYNRTLGQLTFSNGSHIYTFGTTTFKDCQEIRGFNYSYCWIDELSKCQQAEEAWKQIEFATRIGPNPQIFVTMTPLSSPFIRTLVNDKHNVLMRGSTFDNAANLSPKVLDKLRRKYENTRLGRQELYGELLTDTPGAIFSADWFRSHPTHPAPFDYTILIRIVVAIDPAGSTKATSDLTGLIVAGILPSGEIVVLQDASDRLSPEAWSRRALSLFDAYQADAIVAERNFGADMVKSTIRSAAAATNRPCPPVREVSASRGKLIRAEPVAHLYERGLVIHLPELEDLETQMTEWVPPGRFDLDGEPIPPSRYSPDRLDALVWAVTDLALASQASRGTLEYHG